LDRINTLEDHCGGVAGIGQNPRVWAALTRWRQLLFSVMPFDNYGFSQKFGWVSDRFGVSWQLNLPSE
jgi:predicted 3-demethylubiquinone-9 3-methyltransferase (glyoxalase superfamily)